MVNFSIVTVRKVRYTEQLRDAVNSQELWNTIDKRMAMPYNTDIEKRLDKIFSSNPNFSKKKMFGGIGDFLNGNMCVGIYKDFLILRAGKELSAKLLSEPHVRVMDITHKPMAGWVMISPEGFETDTKMQRFIDTTTEFVATLPAKN